HPPQRLSQILGWRGESGERGRLRCRFECSRSPHDKAVVARRAHSSRSPQSGEPKALFAHWESEERPIVKAFRQWFMNYGLVASIFVSTALVAVLAYRLEGSRW